jgi:acetyl esterase/lipase
MTSRPTRSARPPVHRVADLQLRGRAAPLATRVYWPAPCPTGSAAAATTRRTALVVLVGGSDLDRTDALARGLSTATGAVVQALLPRHAGGDGSAALQDAGIALGWAADHAAELGADPRRLVVAGWAAGAGLAAAVAQHACEQGWPEIARQVLLCPDPVATVPDGPLARVAPATVVTTGTFGTTGAAVDRPSFGSRLRRAGVRVDELRYEGLPPAEPCWIPWTAAAELVVADLARSLQHRLGLPPTAATYLDVPDDDPAPAAATAPTPEVRGA